MARLHAAGNRGAGVRIAHFDTEIDPGHPALIGRSLRSIMIDPDGGLGGTRHLGSTAVPDIRHGTVLLAGMASIAPETQFDHYAVLPYGPTIARVLLALDDLGIQASPPDILCLPLGFPSQGQVFAPLLSRLAAKGCLIAAAAGNYGAGRLLAPANLPCVLAVGASAPGHNGASPVLRAYSGSGQSLGRPPQVKPDLAVPAGSGFIPLGAAASGIGGTSAACAQLAATVAVLKGMRPDLSAATVGACLCATAQAPDPVDCHRVRFGFLDLDSAAARLVSGIDLRDGSTADHCLDRWYGGPPLDRALGSELRAAGNTATIDAAVLFSNPSFRDEALATAACTPFDTHNLRTAPIALVRLRRDALVRMMQAEGFVRAEALTADFAGFQGGGR